MYGWTISQRLPVNGLKQVGELFEFNEDFIKSYHEKSNPGYFLEVDVQYPEDLLEPHNVLSFLSEIKKVHKVKRLVGNLEDKKIIYHIHKKFETSITSQTSFEQKSWSH